MPPKTNHCMNSQNLPWYGSSRLGINVKKIDLLDETEEDLLSLTLGNKLYELFSLRPLKINYPLKK
jgi:hypothetical protein